MQYIEVRSSGPDGASVVDQGDISYCREAGESKTEGKADDENPFGGIKLR